MCTALSFCNGEDHYFGRTLDLEYSYCESVTVTPRDYLFRFRHMGEMKKHYAMIGMAYVVNDYPLYYEATNEKGLSMAGLRFQGNACYYAIASEKENVTPFELIPWILGQCENVEQARTRLERLNVVDESFSEELPVSPLHWILADATQAVTIECGSDGMKIHDNPVGVMTNNPPFEMQMFYLNHYLNLTAKAPENRFSNQLHLEPYSVGMGALGLPGDMTSQSRFVRTVFHKLNSVTGTSQEEGIAQYFHIMGNVGQICGSVQTKDGRYERTVYTSCCDTKRGVYYYTTYENRGITGVDLYRENLNSERLICYSLRKKLDIIMQNG